MSAQKGLSVNVEKSFEPIPRVRIAVMAFGDPHDPRTTSGVPSHLLAAMTPELEISGTVSSLPPKLTTNLVRLLSFAPTKGTWRSRWRLSMHQVRVATHAAERDLALLRDYNYDALLQIGTYCNVAHLVRKPIFAYIDHNLPSLVHQDPRMRRTSMGAGYVRRRIAHEKSTLDSCARIFTFSEWCKERVVEDYDIRPARIECVGAGSNIEERMLALEPDYAARHAAFVGFDFERKGGREVLSAFGRVRSQLPSARLTIVGGLPEGEPSPGVTSTGRLVGPKSQERLSAILASASLYVMPSKFEPFGIAFLEAMAAGLPCIGADTCAMPEIIGETGAIVPPGDADSLARRMFEFLSDPEACRQGGRAARARYEGRYGWDKVAARIRRAVEATLASENVT